MSEENKVVYLAASNPKLVAEHIDLLACSNCRNKTFSVTYDTMTSPFPAMKCGACGIMIGRIGWSE